jgi:Peptidase A4 family
VGGKAVRWTYVTTRVGTDFIKIPPSTTDGQTVNIQLVGGTVEWIVEATPDQSFDLGRFGDIFFDECIAGTGNGNTILGGRGNLESMQDVNGNTIAVASAKADELILIQYSDPSP